MLISPRPAAPQPHGLALRGGQVKYRGAGTRLHPRLGREASLATPTAVFTAVSRASRGAAAPGARNRGVRRHYHLLDVRRLLARESARSVGRFRVGHRTRSSLPAPLKMQREGSGGQWRLLLRRVRRALRAQPETLVRLLAFRSRAVDPSRPWERSGVASGGSPFTGDPLS